MARTQDITIDRGEDIPLNVTIYTTDDGTTPQDITGWTLEFNLTKTRDNPTKLVTKSGSIVSAAAGTATVTLDDTDTDGLASGEYKYDIARTNAGYERTLVKGTFTIEGNSRIPAAA